MAALSLAHYQDVLGQLPRLKTYTHILLCFPLYDDQSPIKFIASLEAAARVLADAFPWISCRVVHEGIGPEDSGTFRLAPCPEFSIPNTIVHVKDCTAACPTYQEILDAHGPVSMLDGSVLGPVPAFPQLYSDASLNPAPVFTLQANLIRGGILLDAAAQHNFIDGGGLLRLLTLLAKALRGESFTPEELEHGNRDRSTLIPLLRPDEPMLDHSHLLRESALTSAPQPPPAPAADVHWSFVRFPVAKVVALKSRANEDIQKTNPGFFVSTNDALSAFIWQRISSVRQKRLQHAPSAFSKFSRALDARRALGIPREYLGQMGYNATCRLTFQELQEQSLGEVALFMRQAVAAVNNEYAVRSWATFVAQEPDKSKIMFGGAFNPDTDIGVSSLIHGSVQDVEFGGLGKPELVRRPRFSPLTSCIYLWTQTGGGDVDALLCLKEGDWKGLRDDVGWAGCTEFIG
ncbi:hypothetical protein GQ43DRAFT_446384 [Delitschia confertaspora ATCC 74209]|uniref:Trichothecene 3-O-acetyltransferase-like N-terminal domain-containing protein n=1 Tax=Delitschia confertaspora ATCC 74209 TaxID=1513339 RepID=A0A9P4JTR2_9PLEO|nr:hypothetical protein GQ43DRAFT_446384 [Delitschia confertaspora ATCC 74209]